MKLIRGKKRFTATIEGAAISTIKGNAEIWDDKDVIYDDMKDGTYLHLAITCNDDKAAQHMHDQLLKVGTEAYRCPDDNNILRCDLFSMNDAYHFFNALRRVMPGTLKAQDEVDFLATARIIGALEYGKTVPFSELKAAEPPRQFSQGDTWERTLDALSGELDEDHFVPAGTELPRTDEWPFPLEMVKAVDARVGELTAKKVHKRIAAPPDNSSQARN